MSGFRREPAFDHVPRRLGEYSGLAVRLQRHEMIAKQEQILKDALLDTGEEKERHVRGSAGDERTMRGVPILGSGIGGAIMGTRAGDAAPKGRPPLFDRTLLERRAA